MSKRILIDAAHPEETRVVVVSGNGLVEFDYENRENKPLKGNIYLAKVTRVEPSLQAAFVDYGGNRHGFLPFSEIHPDYYRLPVADREALMAEERAARQQRAQHGGEDNGEDDESEEDADTADADVPQPGGRGDVDGDPRVDADIEQVETGSTVETLTGDEMEDAARRRAAMLGRYKIQEVIKRRQVMLVQVVKEERGTKGAALSTYLSIAGRYCVLMPNTDRGGGVSRKIASAKDRKRLKGVLAELNIPDGMSVIVRTAGADRSKVEIRRDYEHLLRQWDHIRETTLESLAPCLIYEEANLVKRTIRDLYTREMEQVVVEGDEGYRSAKTFMRSLIPSHAKKVQKHDDRRVPLFHKYGVETQLDNIHNPAVQLQSGGYVVINQTEALVAIDVNSGKATKERHIEETALKTNVEAADEIARQLKLRDLAGLIVIDFIDMDATRNNREVEQRLKEAMKQDRARIQLGRISPFGLLELSRQRLRPSLHETSTDVCKTCGGSGFVRSLDSTSLHVLRALEEEGIKRGGGEVVLTIPTSVALYVLNDKRDRLIGIEHRYGFRARIQTDDHLVPPQYRLDRIATEAAATEAVASEAPSEESAAAEHAGTSSGDGESETRKRSKRGGRKKKAETAGSAESQADEASAVPAAQGREHTSQQADSAGIEEARRRRRGKRGGQRRAKRRQEQPDEQPENAAAEPDQAAEEMAGSVGTDQPEGARDASAATKPAAADSADAAGSEGPAQQPVEASESGAASQDAAVAAPAETSAQTGRGRKRGGATGGKRSSRASGGRSRSTRKTAAANADTEPADTSSGEPAAGAETASGSATAASQAPSEAAPEVSSEQEPVEVAPAARPASEVPGPSAESAVANTEPGEAATEAPRETEVAAPTGSDETPQPSGSRRRGWWRRSTG